MAIVEPIESAGPGRRLRCRSPITLEPIGEIDCTTEVEVRAAVDRARKAQAAWAAVPVRARADLVHALLDRIVACQDEVIETVMHETGKARYDAITMDVFASCDAIHYYAKRAERLLRPRKERLHGVLGFTWKLQIVYQPLGVIGLITPWNGPFVLGAIPMAQAILAGNAVVHKPSEVTPFSAQLLERLTREAAFPADLYQVIQGDGQTGAALIESAVDHVSFTGSVETGRRVAQACARRLLPCTLELGGKDPLIVCADADLDRAADGALSGSCVNTGHLCCGTERVYVVADVYDAFVAKVVERARMLRQSDTGECDVGAVFWDRQLEIIERHMEDARSKGARVLVGGRRNPDLRGLYYEPTVVTGVDHDMMLMTQETFGPIVAIQKVRDEDEAISLANASSYGLNGSVYTRDPQRGVELARRIHTGGVCVNDSSILFGIPEAPFGGRRESGIGHVHGADGLRSYCQAQPIIQSRRGGILGPGYPYSRRREATMLRMIRFVYGTKLGRWLV